MPSSRQLAAIMFTDIVGYTALMGDDELKTFELLNKNRHLQKPVIEQYNGRWIKELGDGVMASFNTVSDAVNAAIKIQNDCNTLGLFKLRIGIHLGEVIFDNEDVFGDGVNIASRIQAIAPPGSIWVSESVHMNVVNKKEFETGFVKIEKLKNVKEPVKIFGIKLNASERPLVSPAKSITARLKRKHGSASNIVISVVTIFILFAAGYFIYTSLKTNDHPDEPMSIEADKSIAVLPFVNMSNDKEQEYFSDGLGEELLNLLAKVPGLKVIARTSSFAFKGKNEDIRIISQKLGVAHILEGSVRKAGNRIRITAQLIKASDGSHLWSETYDREMVDIFKVQDDIAKAVVRELKLKLLTSSNGTSTNPEVHNLILQGNYFFDKLDKENVAKALEFYMQALALDSLDARAWAMVANVYSRSAWQNYMDQKTGYAKAKQAALKSVSLDPTSTDGLIALGAQKMYYDFDWMGAKEAFEKVLLIEPANAAAFNGLGSLYVMTGHVDKGIELVKQALSLDPLKPIYYSNQGGNYTYANRIEEANAAYKKALEINPQFQRAHMYLGRNFLLQGKPALALQEMDKENVEFFKKFGLALAYYASGNKNRADELLKDFVNAYHNEWPYVIAELYAFRGEKQIAIEWLEKAYQQNDSWLIWIKGDPLLKSIWSEPGYLNLLKKMNLPIN